MRLKSFPFCVAAAIALAGAPAAMAQVTGEYELTALDGQALPAWIDESENCVEHVMSGRLSLLENGRWDLRYVERRTCGNDVRERSGREDGRYTVQGNMIDFEPDEGDDYDRDADSIDVDDFVAGTIEGNTLTVRLEDRNAVATFTRVRESQ